MMPLMRTTLTIDDDLMAKIEDLRRRDGLSLKEAVNQLLREGIRHRAAGPEPQSYRTPTRWLGLRPGLDPTKLNQLVDELEADHFRSGGRS